MILIFAIFIIVNFIAFDLVSRDDITHFQVSDEVFATNSTNRAKCHGHTVQEYNDFSAITDNGLTVHEIKSIILSSRDKMPPFYNINDPLLADLAKYLNTL
jgi:hypothetical protein